MGFTKEKVNQDQILEDILASNSVWVFGYGSLVWKTDFEYSSKLYGYIEGYERTFYQGSTKHRGTEEKPGRVCTMIPNKMGKVWGVAFEVKGKHQIAKAMEHLGLRECVLGGYDTIFVPFHDENETLTKDALVFIALPSNPLYLGDCSIEKMAHQIVNSKGQSGYNVEYVTKLADFYKENIPKETDPLLFNLDRRIRQILNKKGISLHSLYSENVATSLAAKKENIVSKRTIGQFLLDNILFTVWGKLSTFIKGFINI